MTKLLSIIISLSMKTSILIFLMLICRKLFSKFFNPKINFIIWALIFISLSFPISIESPFSIYNVNNYFHKDYKYTSSISITTNKNLNANKSTNKFISNLNTNKTNNNVLPIHTPSKPIKLNILDFVPYIYLVVSLCIFTFYLFSIFKFYKSLNTLDILKDKNDLINKCKALLNIDKDITILRTNLVNTPTLIGLFKPIILLPDKILNNFNDEQLELILIHELVHFKKGDLFINLLTMIYSSIYWFNPIILYGFYKLKEDIEISCDYYVLKKIDTTKHKSYANLIIDLLEFISKDKYIPLATGMLKRKSQIKRRIIMIKKFHKFSLKLTLTGILIISLVGCTTLSQPKKESKEIAPNKSVSINSNLAEDLLKNKNSIINTNELDIRKKIGNPYVITSFINNKENTKNISTESIYPIPSSEESSALYIYSIDNKIVDVKIDEFSGMPSNSWKSTDYIINSYLKPKESIDYKLLNIPSLEKDFLNKNVYDLNKKFNVNDASIQVFNKNNLRLDIYPIISKNINGPISSLYVLSENEIIKKVKVSESNLSINKLEEHFSLDEVVKNYLDTNLLSPDKINIYNKGKLKTYTKKDPLYSEICISIQNSFEKEFNPLRIDVPKQYVDKSKKETAGIELIYNTPVSTVFPTFGTSTIPATIKTMFIPVDNEYAMFFYESKDGYTTAPLYFKEDASFKQFIK